VGHVRPDEAVARDERGQLVFGRYIERLTEPGMTQALKGRGGICAGVIANGTVRVGDGIEAL
jgi:translation initiation factor 2 gamma subunit (eIF-2gamma)